MKKLFKKLAINFLVVYISIGIGVVFGATIATLVTVAIVGLPSAEVIAVINEQCLENK